MNPYLPAILCALVIFYLSVSSGVQIPDMGISPDKIGHLAAYGMLAWLFFWGLKKDGKITRANMQKTVLGVSGYGIFLEFVQWAFFPHRYFELWDMVANITGACLSYLLFRTFIIKT